jgi:glycosyltransferase involved in cell wall biosynthesis
LGKVIVNLIFNAEALRPPITGIGNYTFHLLEQYVKGALVEDVHCFSGTHWLPGDAQLAITAALKSQGGQSPQRMRDLGIAKTRAAIGTIPGMKALYSYVMDKRFERTANAIQGAVYHETNYILKPYAGPCVTTVHDLSHIRYPQFHPPNVIEWLGNHLPRSLSRADCIITVSDLVRDELIQHFNVPAEKVRTVYEGVEECYKPRTEDLTSEVLSSFGLSHKQYVLLVATLEPRKGIDVLLDAWCLLPEALRQSFPLVLTGSSGWRNAALVQKISTLVAQGTVRNLGYVPAEVLPILFSGAAVFSYPSVYEGFGLPVLDAMSSGVPVICRAGTSMSEFAQGSCVLCDTGEPQELALNIEMLLHSQVVRDQWAQKGIARAAQFSWERCAAETAEIYRLMS